MLRANQWSRAVFQGFPNRGGLQWQCPAADGRISNLITMYYNSIYAPAQVNGLVLILLRFSHVLQMSDLFYKRSRFQQELAEALIESKAINIESIATVIGKYGERAVLEGESLVNILNKNVIINCGWPIPEINRFQDIQSKIG
jgi:hypothetical protein